MSVDFNKETDMVAMAQYVSQLVREGVTFITTSHSNYFTVTLTGGF